MNSYKDLTNPAYIVSLSSRTVFLDAAETVFPRRTAKYNLVSENLEDPADGWFPHVSNIMMVE